MSNLPTEITFLKDVEEHKMVVVRDDGVHRNIMFRKPGTMCMHFSIITWPGYLCYTGDMGTYVFRRLDDMFEFFRTYRDSAWLKSKGLTLGINPSYWGKKLEAADRFDGYRQFSEDKFDAAIRRHFIEWIRYHRDDTSKQERRYLWEAIESEVLCAGSDSGGYRKQVAAHDFYHEVNRKVGVFQFSDFWETNVEDYSYRFMWCCYALAWGIKTYDDSKVQDEVPA